MKHVMLDGATSLIDMADSLDKNYYDALISLNNSMMQQVALIKNIDVHNDATIIIESCKYLSNELTDYIRLRKLEFVPYIQELSHKKDENHDCANCSGSCSVRHADKLLHLQESHNKIKSSLYKIQNAFLHVSGAVHYPDVIRILHNQVILIESTITEIFFLEETYLKPRVLEAQRSINA